MKYHDVTIISTQRVLAASPAKARRRAVEIAARSGFAARALTDNELARLQDKGEPCES